MKRLLLTPGPDGERYELGSPTAMPRAAGFLWNRKMMIHANCRGFAIAQHMQPEPGKYSHAPNMEAQTFMQPEQPYYAHHPGRFVYIKDEENGGLFSAPHEPARSQPDDFLFSVGKNDIRWTVRNLGLEVTLTLGLPAEDAVELWSLNIRNTGTKYRRLSIYPCFTIGYMSWMNQSACYRPDLGGIVASCVTPYQKVEDYPRIKTLKDKTFLLHDINPVAWESAREAFEGEGGLQQPDAISHKTLQKGDAVYESPLAALQYRIELGPEAEQPYRFIFGPALDDREISALRDKYLAPGAFETAAEAYRSSMQRSAGCLSIRTPDPGLDNFVNHWLGRQVFYHGDVNRLSTDPQTRNFLQDHMGMAYFDARISRKSFLLALSQQEAGGAMPDGILVHKDAELKYINQVPHSDHCAWLPVCLQTYLDETGDLSLLDEVVESTGDGKDISVFDRVTLAMRWLIGDRDARGLNFIAQGDWCDPMNMVGHKGKGVSGWLSIATVYALNIWAGIAERVGRADVTQELREAAASISAAVQQHLWDGNWFGRGISDDGRIFGVARDVEGRIFLNPQSWAIMAGVATPEQQDLIVKAVEQQLETPFGTMMLAPSYTTMDEDIGRITQKHAGSAENGSVYNHAAIFYIYSLYLAGQHDRAFKLLRQMIPGPGTEDYLQRGQVPVFVPNYYRGAYYQFPQTAGRSSQLFNTGTASWLYRTLIDGLFGVQGCEQGLKIRPRLPSHWEHADITRNFRGATFEIEFHRNGGAVKTGIRVDGSPIDGDIISEFEPGKVYGVIVTLPAPA